VWDGNAVDYAGASGFVIVVVGVMEAAIAGNDFLIELADGANRPNSFQE